VALSRHVEALGALSGERVLELGCGLGLVGITAGLCGAKVLLTDFMPHALESARINAAINGLDGSTTDFALVDWETPQDIGTFSTVVGAEVLYDYFFHGSLIQLILKILRPAGKVLFADRKRLAVDRFMGRMITAGFRCSEVRTPVQLDGFPEQEITIFELTID
jgi:2-polyprenyl-3-methyl-5-hydroxy-6-metoxy-1,4-benzoquinol methylase